MKVNNYKKKLLEIDNNLDDIIFSINNKREYIIGTYYDLFLNNNFHLNL